MSSQGAILPRTPPHEARQAESMRARPTWCRVAPRLPRPVYGMKPQIEFYEVFAITDNARSTVDLFEAPALR